MSKYTHPAFVTLNLRKEIEMAEGILNVRLRARVSQFFVEYLKAYIGCYSLSPGWVKTCEHLITKAKDLV